MRPRPALNRTHLIIIGLLLLGIVERIVWNAVRQESGSVGEAYIVAQAVAEGRGFADAYRIGQGPTAHLLPISPGFAGLVYMVFGVRSAVSEFVLAGWSIGLALGTYLLLYTAFARIGVPRPLRLVALAWGVLVPTYISQEAVDFRVWEGGLAAFLAALFLDRLMVMYDSRSPATYRQPVVAALVAALLFFVNPPMGLGAIVCMGVFALARLTIGQTLAAAATGALALTMMITPWTLRNQRELGAPVLLRSNAGLELSLTNYPGAETVADEHAGFMARLNRVHPTINAQAYRELKRVGEVAYAARLGTVARTWIAQHPGAAFRQAVGHFSEMFVPRSWKFDPYGTAGMGRIKAIMAQLTGLLGLIGMAMALRHFGARAMYPAILAVTVAVIISPFEPVVRYMYMIYPIMVGYLGCVGLPLFVRGRRGDPTPP